MKREDYIKKATARIFDSRQKRAVTAELEDHIAHRTQALEEIGYDPERAEAQGVEAMGDPAEICDQLGALHNRFYTPVWDIVFLLLWGGLLAGAYYALRQYVFGDVGLTALLNAGACLVPGCACLYGVWCLYQNHPVTAVLYALGLGGSGVYLYFLLQKLSATMGGRFANWQAFLFHQEILKHQGLYANDRAVAGGIAGLLAPGVLLLLAAVIYMLKKAALANTRLDNRLAHVFGRVGAVLGGSGVYLYFLLQKLSATMGGRFANWQAFLFHQEILKHQGLYANDRAVAGGIAGLLAPGVLLLLAAVIYMLKKAALANTRLDNRLAHVFGRVGAVLGGLCLAATIALGVKAPADVRAFAGEYKAVYAYLLQVTQGAKDMDALCAEIENSPYAFEIERTDDGELLTATYQHNYVLAQVEPQEIQSRAELEAEYQKEIARFQDSLEKLGSDPEMAKDISRTYAQSTREQAYRSQVSGIVRLGLNSDLVGTDLDKRSARFLTVDTAGRQALFDRKMAGKKDRVVLEQLSGVVPYKWKVEYTLQRLGNCCYDWTYLVGSDKYRCEAAFSAKRQDTATAAAMEQLDRVAATVEKNPKLRRADLARKIGAKLQAPQVSEDRYTAQYDSLGSRFDQLKEWAHQRYELSFQYQFGDYYFCLAGKPYSTVTLYDKDGCLLSSRFLVSGDFSGTHGNLRRPLLDRGYYDRQGNFYPQPHFVPAYTRDGKAYLYYYWKSPDGDATKNVQYLYAMDDPAARLEPTGAYIDSDGYLVTGVQVKEKQKDGSVTGSDGKTYCPYLRTGWTAQGKPRMAHQPSELEEMLQDLDTAQNTE